MSDFKQEFRRRFCFEQRFHSVCRKERTTIESSEGACENIQTESDQKGYMAIHPANPRGASFYCLQIPADVGHIDLLPGL